MSKAIKKRRILALVLALAIGLSAVIGNAATVEAAKIAKKATIIKVATTDSAAVREGQKLTFEQVQKAVIVTLNGEEVSDFTCDQVGKTVNPIESGTNSGKMKLMIHIGSVSKSVFVPVNKVKSLSVSTKYNPVEGTAFAETEFKKVTTVKASYEKGSTTKKLADYDVIPSGDEVYANNKGKFPVVVAYGQASKKVNLSVISQYTVTVGKANGDSTVSVSVVGDSKVVDGKAVTVNATESSTYKFVKWIDAIGNEVSTTASYTFNVSSNISLLAVYEKVETKKYYVTAIANNGEGNITDGKSTATVVTNQVDSGAKIALNAIPNSGYKFVAWKDTTGKVLSTSTAYSVTVESDLVAIATFESTATEKVTVNVSSLTNGGSITIDGSKVYTKKVEKGASVTVQATANNGYQFKYWSSLSGTVVSLTSTYTFTANVDTNIFAVFEKNETEDKPEQEQKVTVNVSKVGTGTFTINGVNVTSKEITKSAIVSLAAISGEGYTFAGWKNANDVFVSTDSTYTFTATSDVDLIAVFTEIFEPEDELVTVNLSRIGHGMFTINGASTTSLDVSRFSTVTLSASAGTRYEFVGWKNSNDVYVSTDPIYTFTATSDVDLIAVFTEIFEPEDELVTVNLSRIGHGMFTINGASTTSLDVSRFSTVTLSASAGTRYEFVGWKNTNDVFVSTDSIYRFTATEDINLIAVFEKVYNPQPDEQFFVSCFVDGEGTAKITGTELNSTTVEFGSQVSVTAKPETGYKFLYWEVLGEIVSTDETYSFVVTDDIDIVAVFELITINVEISAYNSNGSVSITGTTEMSTTVNYGTQVTVNATANAGYEFTKWINENGATVSTDATYTFTATSDIVLKAVFKQQYVLTINVEGNGSVKRNNETLTTTTYISAGNYTLVAVADEGYHFVNWKNSSNQVVSTERSYVVSISEDTTVTAVFAEDATTVVVTYIATEQTLKSESVVFGETLTPPTDTVYRSGKIFKGWQIDETLYSPTIDGDYNAAEYYNGSDTLSDAIKTLTAAKNNVIIIAVYEKLPPVTHSISVTNGKISVPTDYANQTSAILEDETRVTVVANDAPDGQIFAGWSNGSTIVSNKLSYSFNISSDISLTATYSQDPVKATPIVTMTADTDYENHKILLHMDSEVPNSYNKIKWGYLLVKDPVNSSAELIYNDEVTTLKLNNKDGTVRNVTNSRINLTVTNAVGHTYKFRAIMFVSDNDGEYIVYGDTITITFPK